VSIDGSRLAVGVYMIVLRVEFVDGKVLEEFGKLTLVR